MEKQDTEVEEEGLETADNVVDGETSTALTTKIRYRS